jgi:hypothetical protein
MKQLEARRHALLERCAEQRDELAARLAQLDPARVLRGSAHGSTSALPRHPLAWAAALGGLLLLGRTREVLTFILWIRSALALAGRAAQLVRLLTELRTPRPPRAGTNA